MRAIALVAAACVGALGCGGPAPPAAEDGGSDGSLPDASLVEDGSVDVDAEEVADSMVIEAAVDASADVTAPDAPTCPTPCTASSECMLAYCNTADLTCAEDPAPDGTGCGELGADDICVSGTCVARGCGDGYREPASSPAREGCDDGNTVDGDACSSSCVPTVAILSTDPLGEYDQWPAEQGIAVAADGRGELLVVWAHDHFGSEGTSVRARRYTRGGVPVVGAMDPLVVDDWNIPDPEPQVAGLPGGGWVVAWADDRSGTEKEASYRLVALDGTLGPVRTANQTLDGPQSQVRVTALSDGFVIAWTNLLPVAGEPGKGVLARRFRESGAAYGDEFPVATVRTNDQSDPYLASDGDAWIVLWTHSALVPGAVGTLYGRRYQGAMVVDATPFYVAPMMEGNRGAVASLGGGDYAAAWAQMGDVYARIIRDSDPTPDPTMVLTATATADFETHPSVAHLGGDDFVVVYEAGMAGSHRYDFATSPGATLPAEATVIRTALAPSHIRRASVSSTPDGLWFVWGGYVPGWSSDVLQTHFLAFD